MALVVALIALLALTLLFMATFFSSRSGVAISGNFAALATAQNVAEAGLARGKLVLANHLASHADFSDLLAAGPTLLPWTSFAAGEYTVRLRNNDTYPVNPDPGGATHDSDQTVLLEVQSRTRRGARAAVEALVGRPGTISFPAGEGTLVLCGAAAEGTLDGASVSGYDWALPASFWCAPNCGGSKIDPPTTSDPGSHGLIYSDNAGWGLRYAQINGAVVESPAGFSSLQLDTVFPCAAWLTLARQWASLDAGVKNVHVQAEAEIADVRSWGTRLQPQVTILDPAGEGMRILGQVDGAGILVVTAPLIVPLTASFHYEGVVILLGGRAALSLSGGQQQLFGAVLVMDAPADPALEIGFSNGASLKHSRQAIQTAGLALTGNSSGGLITYAWRNLE